MELERLANTVEQNTKDITALTGQVSRVATLIEVSEKRHDQDLASIKEIAEGIKFLSDRVSKTLGLEKDVAQIKEDVRILTHDMRNIMAGSGATVALDKSMGILRAKVEALETLRDRVEGGASVIGWGAKIFWAVFGAGIVALGGCILSIYFAHPGAISGE